MGHVGAGAGGLVGSPGPDPWGPRPHRAGSMDNQGQTSVFFLVLFYLR